MKKILTVGIGLFSLTLFAQKAKPVLKNTFVTTIVNEGIKNHFSEKNNDRDLVFTLDEDAKLNGEITLKNVASSSVIFKGIMKDNYLIDSAVWYENNNIVKVAHFKDKCCTSTTDYVDPTPKHLSSIKGERQGIERIYFTSKPGVLKALYTYNAGKKHGKQYEYDSLQKLVAIRTFKNGKLNDTSWVNCSRKNPDIEIYTDDVPSGAWKKYNSSGALTQTIYKAADGDSTINYGSDGKIQSIAYQSVADAMGLYTCREYDAKAMISKKYFYKNRTDSVGTCLHGIYEEYANGKMKLSGEYWLGMKVETWISYSSKGVANKWDNYVSRYDAMAAKPDNPTTTTTTTTASSVDLFPPSLSKSTITMVLESNGKVEKIFKKVQEINWELEVKSSTDYKVICNDSQLSDSEKADVISYLTSSITLVKGVRYSHKEVSFVTKYKLVFN